MVKKKIVRPRAQKLKVELLLEIKKLYWWEEKTTYQIAKIYNVNSTTVQAFLKRHGIERRAGGPKRQFNLTASELKNLYEVQGISPNKIATFLETNEYVIYYWLRKYGIKHRGRWPNGAATKCKLCDKDVVKRLANGRLAGTRCKLHQARYNADMRNKRKLSK